MQTLIMVTHPDIEHSVINKRRIEEFSKYPDKFTIHELYKEYSTLGGTCGNSVLSTISSSISSFSIALNVLFQSYGEAHYNV